MHATGLAAALGAAAVGGCRTVPEPKESYFEIDFNPQNTIDDSLVHDYTYAEQRKHYKSWAHAFSGDIHSATRVHKTADGKVTG